MTPYKYIAFISYKREDERWAVSLQRKLEEFNLPVKMREDNPDLPDPLLVFRDKTDLSLGRLQARLREGLSQSKYLIVVCSPNSRKSEWVGKEIQEFIDRGKADLVIPYIVDGKPYSGGDDECFPDVLKSLKGPEELLAANVTEMGEDYAIVKVMAYMLGVEVDSLWNRYEKERQKKIEQRKEEQKRLAAAKSRLFIEQAERMIEEGDNIRAREPALLSLPDRVLNPEQEVPQEAERALRKASLVDSGIINLSWNDSFGDFRSCCYQGGFLFALSAHGIRKYNVSTLKEIKTADLSEDWGMDFCTADYIAPHHDGRTLFIAIGKNLYRTDVDLGAPVELFSNSESIRFVCVRPGKEELAMLDSKNRVILFDLKTGQVRATVKLGKAGYAFNHHLYTSMTYTPDGSRIVLCRNFEKTVSLSAESGRKIGQGKRSGISTLRYYGADGTFLYSTYSRSELIARDSRGEYLYSIPFPSECIPEKFFLDSTETHCAAICKDRPGFIVQVGLIPKKAFPRPKFDFLKFTPKMMMTHRNFEVSGNARWVVFRESNCLNNLETGKSITLKFLVDFATFSFDSRYLLAGNEEAVHVIDLETMEVVSNTRSSEESSILSASFIDGSHDIIVSYGENEDRRWTLRRYRMDSGKEELLGYSPVIPLQVRYIDGNTIAEIIDAQSFSSEKSAAIVNLASGESLCRMELEGDFICSGNSSGELLVCTRESLYGNSMSAIAVCNVNRNEKVLIDIRDNITVGHFSPSGDLLVLSSEKKIYIVSTSTNAVILDFSLDNDGTAVAFSDDDRKMTVFALSSNDALVSFPLEIEELDTIEERLRQSILSE